MTSITEALAPAQGAFTPQHILNEGARRLLALGRPDLAEAFVARALAESGDNADTHSVAAAVIDAQGDWSSALAHLRRAHVLMPNAPQVRLNLAMALLRQGDYCEGLAMESWVFRPLSAVARSVKRFISLRYCHIRCVYVEAGSRRIEIQSGTRGRGAATFLRPIRRALRSPWAFVGPRITRSESQR